MYELLKKLPPEYSEDLLPVIRTEFERAEKTLVIFDDDPTGTQTSYDVTVLTRWEVPLLVQALKKHPSVLFILTNSRSLSKQKAIDLTLEIGNNLKQAVKESGRQVIPISRSDSTLRGHFPYEVNAIAQSMGLKDAVWILLPAFIEGGRITINDVHYLREQDKLIPVAETPFAADKSFGYKNSDLKLWVQEKSNGEIKSEEVVSLSLELIRTGGPHAVRDLLTKCQSGNVCIINALSYKDIEVVARGLQLAELEGKKFLFRTSATFIPIRAGMTSGKIYQPIKDKNWSQHGSLVVVGSYVPKSTSQLEYLLSQNTHQPIEIDVNKLLQINEKELADYAIHIIHQINELLLGKKDVVLFTSRTLEIGFDAESSLIINNQVASFLVSIISEITVRPSYIIAKGGITSSDIVSHALHSQSAQVLGQALPGIPVWQLDEQSKFPGLTYVVFPGNVGDVKALSDLYRIFT